MMEEDLDLHFKDWTPPTEVVIVGNSPSMAKYEFGQYIDQFDTVVRLNECLHEEYFPFTGEKLDVWATTSNDRWGDYNPITPETKEVWVRTEETKKQLKENNTLKDFKGEVTVLERRGVAKFGKGIPTGLLAIYHARLRYQKVSIIGNTFYLDSDKNNLRLEHFYAGESEIGAQCRQKHHHNSHDFGKKVLVYISKWMVDKSVVLLNPFEYDNLPGLQ